MACTCSDPPVVSNGIVRSSGPYSDTSRAVYDCDDGYTNTGASSRYCQNSGGTCSWVDDPTTGETGLPQCDITAVTSYTVTKNYDQLVDNLPLLALLIAVFLLLLILLLLLLWWCCCRECCRHCCMRKCAGCCHCCCDDVPYADTPRTRGRAYRDYDSYYNRYDRMDEKRRLDQERRAPDMVEPRDLVNRPDGPQGVKPIDTRGNPVWMPHAHNVRPYKTSTK